MPQKLTESWKSYLTPASAEQYGYVLHSLGNLALTDYNSEMSNKDFDDKKKIYKNSRYYYTTQICEYASWQVDDIEHRSHELAREALKVWKLPENCQKDRTSLLARHSSMSEDFGQFKFTKPALLVIGDEEYAVSAWSDVSAKVVGRFYDENPDALYEIARKGEISALTLIDEEHPAAPHKRYTHVTENLYMSYMSTGDTLNTVARIAKAFDKLVGTDYAENILFALKP